MGWREIPCRGIRFESGQRNAGTDGVADETSALEKCQRSLAGSVAAIDNVMPMREPWAILGIYILWPTNMPTHSLLPKSPVCLEMMRIGSKMIAPTFGIVADYHRRYDPVHKRRWLEMRVTRWLVSRHPKMNGQRRRQWIRRVAGV